MRSKLAREAGLSRFRTRSGRALIDDQQLLAQKPDVNYGALSEQPSPEDYFLLSRVKGVVTVAQLCTASGLGRDKTIAAIEKLLRVGLLHKVDADGNPVGGDAAPASATAASEPAQQPTKPESNLRVEQRHHDDGGVTHGGMLGEPPSLEMDVDSLNEPTSADDEDDVDDLFGGGDSSDDDDDLFGGGSDEQSEAEDELFGASNQQPQMGHQSPPGDLFTGNSYEEPSQPSQPSQPSSSLNTAPSGGEEDDLFMPSSPAHLDRIEGRAPVKRSRSEAQVTEQPAQARPAQAQPAPQAEPAKPKKKSSGGDPYHLFPTPFASWEPQDLLIDGIDEDLQLEIRYVHEHLDQLDFYQLFGVSEDADRRDIRKRYFAMSKQFHPDKFFRDEVGDLAAKVEDIFKFVTKGYQTLSKKNKRAEYDEALAASRQQHESAAANEDRKREMAAEMLKKRAAQLEEQGQLTAAADEWRKVAAILRDTDALLKAATLLLRSNQRLDEAAKLARGVAGRVPNAVEPRLVLGQIYEKNGMFEEAAAAFAEAEGLAPGDPSVRVHLERVRAQLG